jgi:hypothetical protein
VLADGTSTWVERDITITIFANEAEIAAPDHVAQLARIARHKRGRFTLK